MFNNGKSTLALPLAALAASVQGAAASIIVPYVDQFVSGSVSVGIGSPPTEYSLLFDPASSNTWVGAGKAYTKTSSSKDTGNTVSVSYGSGSFSGEEYTDSLKIKNITITQSIGAASKSQGLNDVDGILGLGPTDLTEGTVSNTNTVPTILDNLVSAGIVKSHIITINNGTVTLGGKASTKVTYTPFTTSSPVSDYWGLDASFAYAADSLASSAPGIIDHGTSLLLLQTSSYKKLVSETGATVDSSTGLPALSSCKGLEPVIVTLGSGMNISIPIENYRWPVDQNAAIGGNANTCYLAIGDLGGDAKTLHSGPGRQFRQSASADADIQFILGFNTLKHYTVVLDAEESRIGIGK